MTDVLARLFSDEIAEDCGVIVSAGAERDAPAAQDLPWLTVIIPVHNGAPLLDSALAGIAAENPAGVEVLIYNSADDGGAAKQIADRYQGRIAITWHERPDLSNWTYKANAGAKAARAAHISVLCHDDFWLPGHLAALRASLARYPDAAISVAPSRFAGPDGKLLGPWKLPFRPGLISGQQFGAAQLVQCTVAINGAALRRDAFLASGGFDEGLWFSADWDLYLKMAKSGPVDVRPVVTSAYRVHGGAQTYAIGRDIDEYRRQLGLVIERHLRDFIVPGSPTECRARMAAQLNCVLALAASGKPGNLFKTLLKLMRLGPGQIKRLLDETRLIDRMRPRLRLALAQHLRVDSSTSIDFQPDQQHSLRYVVVALPTAIFANVVLIGGDAAGMPYPLVVLVSWFVTGTVAYALHANFTFRARLAARSWIRFMAGNALGIPACIVLLGLGKMLGLPMVVSAPITTVILFAYNYINARLAILQRIRLFSSAR